MVFDIVVEDIESKELLMQVFSAGGMLRGINRRATRKTESFALWQQKPVALVLAKSGALGCFLEVIEHSARKNCKFRRPAQQRVGLTEEEKRCSAARAVCASMQA